MSIDPLFKPLIPATVPSLTSTSTTLSLLQAAFPDPSTVQQIYSQKVDHRPLNVNPASDSLDARSLRRQKRQDKLKRKRKPKPLSAKKKRELRIYDIPKDEVIYTNFLALNKLWNEYISEIISPKGPTTTSDGPTLLKADYHGAYITIEDCRCKSRVGLQGICLKETKNTFEIITTENRLLKIPKEKSLFRVRATRREGGEDMEWRLWGDQVLTRSGERAARKFSGRTIRGKALLEL